MTEEQYLLIKLAEECNEVAQRALKAAQFGLLETQDGQPLNNMQRLSLELDDIGGVINLLHKKVEDFEYTPSLLNMQRKEEKVVAYFQLSKDLGKVL